MNKTNLAKDVSAVIFDMDGVLLDSEPIYRKVQDSIFCELGFSVSDQEYDEFIGIGLKKMWQIIKRKREISLDIPQLIEMNNQKLWQHIEGLDELFPSSNLLEFIQECKEMNLKIAVASSTALKIVNTILHKLGIGEYFDQIVSGEAVKTGKPAPDIFLLTASLLNTLPENCLVIEDSQNGVLAAKSAGMFCLGYNNPNSGKMDLRKSDIIVNDFLEVRRLFKQ